MEWSWNTSQLPCSRIRARIAAAISEATTIPWRVSQPAKGGLQDLKPCKLLPNNGHCWTCGPWVGSFGMGLIGPPCWIMDHVAEVQEAVLHWKGLRSWKPRGIRSLRYSTPPSPKDATDATVERTCRAEKDLTAWRAPRRLRYRCGVRQGGPTALAWIQGNWSTSNRFGAL